MQRTREKRPEAASGDAVHERLRALLDAGRARARTLGRPVLASTTERVSGLRAIDVLDPRARTQMYWAMPAEGFALAGIDAATTLIGRGETRYEDVARAWEQLLADTVHQDDAPRIAGGPVLMGGFAFDPDGPRTATWKGFDAASFTVPQLSVTSREGESWLTLNALVGEDTDVESQTAALTAAREAALTAARQAALTASVPGSVPSSVPSSAPPSDLHAAGWQELVANAVHVIQSGRLEKVVLAREVTTSLPRGFDVLGALRHLTHAQPSTFIYGVWRGDAVFFGASPERLVRLQGRDVSTGVLAGSAPRGSSRDEDARNAAGLLASDKDIGEHEIVRRDIESALMPVCDAVVTDLRPSLVSLAHVHHLATSVRARLEDGRTVFDVIERLHPTPAVGGSPRRAALAFIREHEDLDRGWYAAPLGWVGATAAEFAVALRCSLVRGRRAAIFAGCGIVAQSDPEAEYQESQAKLLAAREALVAGSAARAAANR